MATDGIISSQADSERRIGILTFVGSPLAYPTVQGLWEKGFRNISLICDGDKMPDKFREIISARTQGRAEFHPPVAFEQFGSPFYFVKNHNSQATLDLIQKLDLEVLVSAGTPRKLSDGLLKACRFGVINCHPGRLPDYRGSSVVEWALSQGDSVSATAHFMTADYDAGPIIQVYPFSTEGLSYHDIRFQMIGHQARGLVDATARVLRANKEIADYPPQSEGKLWPTFPEADLAKLLERTF